MNLELSDVQAGFRKARRTWDQIANIPWIIEKTREFQKNICFIDYTKAFDCVNHNKLWKILKEMGILTTWPASWETCMKVKKQQLEQDMEQQTDSKSRKEYVKAIYCHPAYLTYMQNTSWETLGWMKQELETRLPGEISITSVMQMKPPLWQKVKKLTNQALDESERGEWKGWLKIQHSKNEDHGFRSHHFMASR